MLASHCQLWREPKIEHIQLTFLKVLNPAYTSVFKHISYNMLTNMFKIQLVFLV